MGLMPSPEVLAEMRQTEEEGESRPKILDSPYLKSEVSQKLMSLHWTYQKRVLDHTEAVIANERQWKIVRRIIMDIQTEQLNVMIQEVGQIITRHKENKDGEPTLNSGVPGSK
jgi:hypothetical protein